MCPDDLPYRCDNGQCAQTVNDCVDDNGCLLTETFCEDGVCRADCTGVDATCTNGRTHCPDGSCGLASECPLTENGCDADTPVRCSNGRCVSDNLECVVSNFCPPMDVVCATGICQVPGHRCPDGVCALSLTSCQPLDDEPESPTCTVRCADGRCVDAADECMAIGSCPLISDGSGAITQEVRCGDGTCRASEDLCPLGNSCEVRNPDRPVRCKNGACAATANECMCDADDEDCVTESNPNTPAANGCTVALPGKCDNGLCVSDVSLCSTAQKDADDKQVGGQCAISTVNGCAPDTPEKCIDGSCVADATSECPLPNGCLFAAPFRCNDGTCATQPDQCSANTECGAGLQRCSDGSCAAQTLDCPLRNNCPARTPLRCGDGACVATPWECSNTAPCPRQRPFKCADGSCVVDLTECSLINACSGETPVRCCQDNSCRASEDDCAPVQSSTNDDACPVYAPIRCPDGACKRSGTECSVDASICLAGQLQCVNGDCVSAASECHERLGRCDSGTCQCLDPAQTLCFNGHCVDSAADCAPLPHCPSDQVRCADMSCAESPDQCDEFDGEPALTFNGCGAEERLCNDGCRPAHMQCDQNCTLETLPLMFGVKPMTIEVTVDARTSTTALLRTNNGAFAGSVVAPAASLTRRVDKTRPLTVRLGAVADSSLRGSMFTVGGGTTEAQVSHTDVVSSSVVSLEVVDAGDAGFNGFLRKDVVVQLPFASVCSNVEEDDEVKQEEEKYPTKMCLGVLNGDSNTWSCHSSSVIEVRTGVYSSKISQVQTGQNVFALLEYEDIPFGVAPEDNDGDDVNDDGSSSIDGGVISGSILAAASVAVGFSYVTWRLHRYRTKYRAWKAEREAGDELKPIPEPESDPQLVVNPMFLAQQQLLQKRLADVEGGMTMNREMAEDASRVQPGAGGIPE